MDFQNDILNSGYRKFTSIYARLDSYIFLSAIRKGEKHGHGFNCVKWNVAVIYGIVFYIIIAILVPSNAAIVGSCTIVSINLNIINVNIPADGILRMFGVINLNYSINNSSLIHYMECSAADIF